MIFFNVPEARNQLIEKGLVYTLRSSTRSVGRTRAVTGSYAKNTPLCEVAISRMITVRHPEDLYPYLHHSGFNDIDTWLSKATPSARTLYKVEKFTIEKVIENQEELERIIREEEERNRFG